MREQRPGYFASVFSFRIKPTTTSSRATISLLSFRSLHETFLRHEPDFSPVIEPVETSGGLK